MIYSCWFLCSALWPSPVAAFRPDLNSGGAPRYALLFVRRRSLLDAPFCYAVAVNTFKNKIALHRIVNRSISAPSETVSW